MLVRHASQQAKWAFRRAFTLMEVLVVVAIIVMLAGVGGYYIMQQYDNAKLSKAKMDVEGLSGLVEQYKLSNGEFPASIEALAMPQPNGGGPLSPPDKLKDPWGKPYQIDPSGTHNSGMKADVFTQAPNGQMIGNWGQ
jgi:general secretion pathway protein G